MNVLQKKAPIIAFIILLSLVCISLTLFTGYSYWSNSKSDAIADFQEASNELNYRLGKELNKVINIAANNSLLAANSPLLRLSIRDPQYVPLLQKSWENMFVSANSLYQIRYLDLSGKEVFRGNREQNKIVWITGDDLQDKSSRDYFVNGMADNYQIYLSAIDLNKENGVIEIPLRPTIRASAKFFENGELLGLVVLNFDLSEAFAFFKQQQSLLKHWIVNEDGYFISSPNDSEWGWLIDQPTSNAKQKFAAVFDAAQNNIVAQDLNEGFYATSVQLNSNLDGVATSEESFYVVSELSQSVYQDLRQTTIITFTLIALVVLLIILVAIYIDRIASAMQKSEALANDLADKAEQSERAKASFLAQMSHEIRTPMNGMYGLLQLTQGERNYKKINKNLDQAVGSFRVLKRIIDDILDFSKIEAGKLTLVNQSFRLDATFREVAQIMGRAGYGKTLDMWIDIAPECPREVIGDAVRVNQILFNLTNNAIKFTETGEIKLQVKLVEESSENVVLGFCVSDTGVGMNEQEISQVFEAFTQASDTTHRKFGGTGLGLSIVKQLIELMGGKININSERGKGTQFEFTLKFNKANNSRSFAEFSQVEDAQFYEALIYGFSPSAVPLIKKQCAILGWPTQTLSQFEDIRQTELRDNSKRLVLIVDENILDDADISSGLSKTIKENPGISKVLVASYGSAKLNELEKTPFENVIIKPFTPSTLYDAVVSFDNEALLSTISEVKNQNAVAKSSEVLSGLSILLAEDNEINQMVFTAMLESAGAVVKVASNGQECVDKLALERFDIVCMDIQMPIMDGIEATKLIRENTHHDNIPIIALTANALEEDRKRSIDAGMQLHVAKPIERAELIDAVRKLACSRSESL